MIKQGGSLYYQPKRCTMKRAIPQNSQKNPNWFDVNPNWFDVNPYWFDVNPYWFDVNPYGFDEFIPYPIWGVIWELIDPRIGRFHPKRPSTC